METLNMEINNIGPILGNLSAKIKNVPDLGYTYLRRPRNENVGPEGPMKNALGVVEFPLPAILIALGIRSMTLEGSPDLMSLYDLTVTLPAETVQGQWVYYKDEAVLAALREVFQKCSTVSFDDWSHMAGASDLWEGLLRDVIRPVGKNDIEFIFYLGDAMRKLWFEVDEALDIISAFSKHGNVTFALDENEAVKLWMVLNGVHQETLTGQTNTDLKKKYFSVFRTMSIARLVIYSATNVIVFSEAKQFVLSRRLVDERVEIGPDARRDFIAGYSTGFLMDYEPAHCVALGLIVFGAAGELQADPEQKDLLAYIDRWIADLNKPDAIYLYQ